MADKKFPQWQGHRLLHESHASDLEHRAALEEFEHGHSRGEAERRAYHDYSRDHHREAAAHHLRGMRAAQGSGDMDESRKHGIAYGLHLKALGLDPLDEVPAEIRAMIDGDDRQPHYKFKTHKGDILLLQDHHEGDDGEDVHKALEKGDVINLSPKLEAQKQAQKQASQTKIQSIFDAAGQAMAQDPGFQELARKRQVQAKADKLKSGPALFGPGSKVLHTDQESYPWVGTVTSHNYRENDIDGPGHYYEVKWWNPKAKQFHQDYLHQDLLKPASP